MARAALLADRWWAVLSANRWWVYQRERYPLLVHGPMIAAFSFSGVAYSSLLRGRIALPAAGSVVVAFTSALLFFLQLRIADEFKDFEDDARYRPYRPVPRGLVNLRELGIVAGAGALVQLGLAAWLSRGLLLLLGLAWLYLGLMSQEFFVGRWLRAHPFTYMWTHMLIMPLIDLYTTACDWLVAGGGPPRYLVWFLVVSFFNGIIVEIGRKIRAPEDEERGVETYTVLWGQRNAVLAWLLALLLTGLSAWVAATQIDFSGPIIVVLGVLLAGAGAAAWAFLRRPVRQQARLFELLSGVWTLTMYLSLGAVPLLLRV